MQNLFDYDTVHQATRQALARVSGRDELTARQIEAYAPAIALLMIEWAHLGAQDHADARADRLSAEQASCLFLLQPAGTPMEKQIEDALGAQIPGTRFAAWIYRHYQRGRHAAGDLALSN